MHIQNIIANIERMDADELDRIQEVIDRRRQEIGSGPVSIVVERRDYRNGILQLEKRAYRRKDGGLTERGPYWYFHYREGGRQRTQYLGQTDNPEKKVDELMEGKDG
jgi:hypothetical protein